MSAVKAKPTPPCHLPTEIVPGLVLFKATQLGDALRDFPVSRVVTLNSSQQINIWSWDFEGIVDPIPIPDGGVLPFHILQREVERLSSLIMQGETIAIHCVGGHGRTGYMAAAIIGTLFPDVDPIEYVRSAYCINAIETFAQVDQLGMFFRRSMDHHTPSYHYPLKEASWKASTSTKKSTTKKGSKPIKTTSNSAKKCPNCGRSLRRGRCVNAKCGSFGR